MAAGRKMKLYKGTGVGRVLVTGGREHGIKINNEALDETDKDANGWRTLAPDVSMRSVDVSFEGLFKAATLVSVALNSTVAQLLDDYELEIEGFGKFAGEFFLTSLENNGSHDDSVLISGELQSSGVITWTAAS